MATKLFVAGLPYSMSDNDLRDMFAQHGTVTSAQIVTDRDTRRSKGFGFVEFSTESEGNTAISELNGKEVEGRPLTVNVARPQEDRSSRPNQDRRGSMGNNFRRSNR
jgi:cold-inducible RNA-binding protein